MPEERGSRGTCLNGFAEVWRQCTNNLLRNARSRHVAIGSSNSVPSGVAVFAADGHSPCCVRAIEVSSVGHLRNGMIGLLS